ncbi:MAG: hypothetical protein Q4G40_02665 [Brachybacterium sp.]|nr:hypothetical protein [Brachybacterium sp.]
MSTDTEPTPDAVEASASTLSMLKGAHLRSVEFGIHHVTLGFDAPEGPGRAHFTMWVQPTVTVEGRVIPTSDERWAGALRDRITETVVRTNEAVGTGLRLEFTHGSVRVHPRAHFPEGTVVAELEGLTEHPRVWRSGAECFDDIH